MLAEKLHLKVFVHHENLGYGANQKTCYREALRLGADIAVMLHPDYQYEPRLVTAMAAMVSSGVYDVAIASRILGSDTLKGGMPLYKYVSNRLLSFLQNLLLGAKLSEYHTGYRAFSRKVLEELPLLANSDDFVFDNQMLTQAIAFGYRVGEISCPTRYFPEASSISFRRSVVYGLGVLVTSIKYRLWKWRLLKSRLFRAAHLAAPALRLRVFVLPARGAATMSWKILVTGGAGFIGSVVTEQLVVEGHDVVVLDTLKYGFRAAVTPPARLVCDDILDEALLDRLFRQERFDAVAHLAAEASIDDSIRDPGLYYRVNLSGGLSLLSAMVRWGVERIVFSSTAAVYGQPEAVPIVEDVRPPFPAIRTAIRSWPSSTCWPGSAGAARFEIRQSPLL